MTKPIQIARQYAEELRDLGARPVRFEDQKFEDKFFRRESHAQQEHMLWMCEQLAGGHVDGEKAHRWLGFVQGAFWVLGRKTIGQMKADNSAKREP